MTKGERRRRGGGGASRACGEGCGEGGDGGMRERMTRQGEWVVDADVVGEGDQLLIRGEGRGTGWLAGRGAATVVREEGRVFFFTFF